MSTHVTAIIQARMKSTRLPNKVMMEVLGRPLLWHMLKQLSYSQYLTDVIVATSDSPEDRAILAFCDRYGIRSFAGSENDVLDRFYCACLQYNVATVVRLCGDCPLIDPKLVDWVVASYLKYHDSGGLDYIHSGSSYPDGIVDTEVFEFTMLEKCWSSVVSSADREHVTSYIRKHPEVFSVYTLEHNSDLHNLRLTVDDWKDFALVGNIISELFNNDKPILLGDVLEFLGSNPHLVALNRGTERDAWRRDTQEDGGVQR